MGGTKTFSTGFCLFESVRVVPKENPSGLLSEFFVSLFPVTNLDWLTSHGKSLDVTSCDVFTGRSLAKPVIDPDQFICDGRFERAPTRSKFA